MSNDLQKVLSGLDEAQQKVAEHFDGPCLVIAGPGAGKTRCLIHRVVALLARGIPDSQILAVTFTKNAAEEMNGRLDDLMENLGVRGRRPTISTFHSFGFSLLRNNGYGGYTVLKNKKTMIINVIKDLGYRTEEWLPEDVIIAIAKAKNSLMGPEEMRQQLLSDHQATSMSDFYSLYEKRKNEERVLDFDDMLYYAWKLLSSNERLRAEVRERYRYVMVDECQDNNKAQIELAQLVATKDGNLMMIGDDCQGIYAWRGAVPQFMLEFAERPNVEKLFLARNYRSVNVIVRAANRLIEKNTERIPKELFTQREEGVQPVIVSHRDTGAEAQWVKDQIKAGLDAGMKPKDFAVLYRSNYQSAPVEDALRKTGIPYIIYGSAPFFGRAEIMDVVAYLKLIGDPNDDDALERAYNTPPRYLGKAWWNEYRAAKGRTGDALRTLNGRFSRPYMERGARSLANDIAHLRSLKAMTPVEIIEDILDVRGTVHPDQTLQQHYERPEERGGEVVSDRAENVRELIEIARQYGTYEEFMEFIAEASTVKDKEAQLSSDTVKLMTIHRSKGLEFTWVFGVGWGEGMLPHIKSMAADKIQEERRLAYVAITRAKDKVHLSHVQEKFGRFIEPSRFLTEAFDPEVLGQLHEQMADAEAPEDVDSAEDSVVVNGPWAKKTLPRT